MSYIAAFHGRSPTITMRDFSNAQYILLLVAFNASSLLSICGSALIIMLARRDLSKVYHRTLVMLSAADILMSASNTVHFLMLPSDKTTNPVAIGNDASCSVVGFMLNVLWTMVAIYNAFLSINFVLQIRYQYTDEQLSKRIEPIIHTMAFVLSLPLPLYGLTREAFNPESASGLCLMVSYPPDCHLHEDVECIRGDSNLLAILQALVVNVVSLIGFGCTWLLYRTVKDCIDKTMNRSLSHATNLRHSQHLRNVSWQCTRYALAYFNTWIWPLFHQVLANVVEVDGHRGEMSRFIPILLPFLFFPLQGMLNFIVFITPRYQQWRSKYPDESCWYLLRCTLSTLSPSDRNVSTPPYGSRFRPSARRPKNLISNVARITADGKVVWLDPKPKSNATPSASSKVAAAVDDSSSLSMLAQITGPRTGTARTQLSMEMDSNLFVTSDQSQRNTFRGVKRIVREQSSDALAFGNERAHSHLEQRQYHCSCHDDEEEDADITEDDDSVECAEVARHRDSSRKDGSPKSDSHLS